MPGADELEVGARIVGALPFATLLYARVDLIRGADGGPRLLELELTEPSLFFPYGPGSAARLLCAALCAAARALAAPTSRPRYVRWRAK